VKILFGLLLLLHLFELTTLALDFLLLLLDLALGLLLLVFLVLHRVANRVTPYGAEPATDRRAGAWMPDGSTDYGSGTGSQEAPSESSLFPRAKRLTPAASG
jgi:hypothetical protein